MLAPDQPRHRTEVSTRADQDARLKLTIDDPAIGAAFYALDRDVLAHLGAAAPHQVLIKLAPPDAVADRPVVSDVRFPLSQAAHPKRGNGLEGAATAVF